jgi:hypothetical protein
MSTAAIPCQKQNNGDHAPSCPARGPAELLSGETNGRAIRKEGNNGVSASDQALGGSVTVIDGADPIFLASLALLLAGIGGTIALALWTRHLPPGEQVSLSLATLMAGVTCCGGAGILARRLFEFGALRSTLARFARQATARSAALDDLVGGLAAVVVPIEPGRVGAVAPRNLPPALTVAAISRHAAPLPVGTTVVVTATRAGRAGDAVEVAPLPGVGQDFLDAAS